MRKRLVGTLITTIFVLGSPLAAQTHLGIGGGVTLPAGKSDSTLSSGSNVLAFVTAGGDASAIALRLDYTHAELKGATAPGATHGGIQIDAVTLNLVGAAGTNDVKVYALTGAGWYPIHEATGERVSHFGANAGLGLSVPVPFAREHALFLESRYHYIAQRGPNLQRRFVPVTIGLIF